MEVLNKKISDIGVEMLIHRVPYSSRKRMKQMRPDYSSNFPYPPTHHEDEKETSDRWSDAGVAIM